MSTSYYLRTGFGLSATSGAARTFRDVTVNSTQACPQRPFTTFGTWSLELP